MLLGFALGLGILSQILLMAGFLRLMSRAVLWPLLLLAALVSYSGIKEFFRWVIHSLAAFRHSQRKGWHWVLLASGMVFLSAWAPPHHYDSLVYHLALPQRYILEKGIVPIPQNLYAYFPQNAEMLYALCLLLDADVLTQLLNWASWMTAAGLIFVFAKRLTDARCAFLSVLFLAFQPTAMLLAGSSYVESLLGLWITCTLFCFERYRNQRDRNWLVLSAVFSGLSMGTKYYAVITAGILSLFLLGSALRNRQIFPKHLFLYAGIAGLIFSPWLVRNWISVQNPVFPFFHHLFTSEKSPWAPHSAEKYFRILAEYNPRGNFWTELVRLPWKLGFGSLPYGGGMDVLGTMGWVIHLLAFPGWFWAAKKFPALRPLMVYALLHGCLWFLTGTVLRFLSVLLPILSLLTAASLYTAYQALTAPFKKTAVFLLGVFLLHQTYLFVYVQSSFQTERPVLGLETRDEFLSRRLSYYPAARWVNENLPKNATILLVGEQRSYYFQRKVLATTVFADNIFSNWPNEAKDSETLRNRLKGELGVTHLLLIPKEAERLQKDYRIFDWTPLGEKNWKELLTRSIPLQRFRDAVLYALP